MATFIQPELRSIVEEILKGERTSGRVTKNTQYGKPEVGDKVLFYSASTVPAMPTVPEYSPDINPLAVVVRLNKVEDADTIPGGKSSYQVSWGDDLRDVFSDS